MFQTFEIDDRRKTTGGLRWTRSVMIVAAVVLMPMLVATAGGQRFGDWSPADSVDPGRVSGVNTPVNDGCPIEAADGWRLFFASNRNPQSTDPNATKDLDIWVASRNGTDGSWSHPAPLPAPVNTGAAEFCPTPLPGNQLLFVSTRGSTCGGGNNADIYYTRLQMHPVPTWLAPVALPCDVNSPNEEFSPSVVEDDGRTILFFSSNRDNGTPGGPHKIYASELQADGTWMPATRVEELSSAFSDARPNVRKDGLEIVFDSNRGGTFDVYTARRSSLSEAWSHVAPLGVAINSAGDHETRASLSRDGTRLYFGSTRANAQLGGTPGSADIYVSTRSGPGARNRH